MPVPPRPLKVEWYGWTAIDGQLFDASYNRAPGAVEVQQQNVPKGFWEGEMEFKQGTDASLEGWIIVDGGWLWVMAPGGSFSSHQT